MKQRDLVKKLEKAGFEFARHGGNHDIYKRGDDEEKIPRHREINERLARAILRKWGLKNPLSLTHNRYIIIGGERNERSIPSYLYRCRYEYFS